MSVVRIIASREQMNALKAQGWTVFGTWGGGEYIMESPQSPTPLPRPGGPVPERDGR